MADETIQPIADLMTELNKHRYLQHRTFEHFNGDTLMLVLLSFDEYANLMASYHDVRQPLVYYTMPMAMFKHVCSIPDREQNENKLPEEKAAEATPSA